MNDEQRQQLQRAAYASPVVKIDGLEIRPLSACTLDQCLSLGIKVVTGSPEEKEAMSPRDRLREMQMLLFLLSQPWDDLDRIVDELGGREDAAERFYREYIRPFSRTVSVGVLNKLDELMEKVIAQSEAANFEVVPKPPVEGAAKGPTPPGNS